MGLGTTSSRWWSLDSAVLWSSSCSTTTFLHRIRLWLPPGRPIWLAWSAGHRSCLASCSTSSASSTWSWLPAGSGWCWEWASCRLLVLGGALTLWSWPGSPSATTLLKRRPWFSPGCDCLGWCGPLGIDLGRLRALLPFRLLQRGAGFVEALADGRSDGLMGVDLGRLRALLHPRLLQRGAGFFEAGMIYDFLNKVASLSRLWLVHLVL